MWSTYSIPHATEQKAEAQMLSDMLKVIAG